MLPSHFFHCGIKVPMTSLIKKGDHLLAAINSYIRNDVPLLTNSTQIRVPDEVLCCMENMAEASAAASSPSAADDSAHMSETLRESIKRTYFTGTHGRESKDSHVFFECIKFVAGLIAPYTILGTVTRDLADICLLAINEHAEALNFPGPALVSACLDVDALSSERSCMGERTKLEKRSDLNDHQGGVGKIIISSICSDVDARKRNNVITSTMQSVLLPNWTAYMQLATAFPLRYVKAIISDRLTAEVCRDRQLQGRGENENDVFAEDDEKSITDESMHLVRGDMSVVRGELIKEASEVKVMKSAYSREIAQYYEIIGDEHLNRAELHGDVCIPLGHGFDPLFKYRPITKFFVRSEPFHRLDTSSLDAYDEYMDKPREYLDEQFWNIFRSRGVICAGGAPLSTLLGVAQLTSGWAGDVDLFLIRPPRARDASSMEEYAAREANEMAQLTEDVARYLMNVAITRDKNAMMFAYVSRNALTLQFSTGMTKIQIMTRPFVSIRHVLSAFDLDPCRVAYDGSLYYITRSAAVAIAYRAYALQPRVHSTLYRVCKYTSRGFACVVPAVMCHNNDSDEEEQVSGNRSSPEKLDAVMRAEGATPKGLFAAAELGRSKQCYEYCRCSVVDLLARRYAEAPETQEMSSSDWWSPLDLYRERNNSNNDYKLGGGEAVRANAIIDIITSKLKENDIMWTEEPLTVSNSVSDECLPRHIRNTFECRVVEACKNA